MRLMLMLLAFLMANSLTAIAEEDEGMLTFCRFGPKMKVVTRSGSGCSARAKIQGLLWECNSPEKNSDRVQSFLWTLNGMMQRECERFCKDQGKCRAHPMPQSTCGLSTTYEDALILGKRFGCRPTCTGKGFIYCSLYNAGFRIDEPLLVSRQPENCRCMPPG